MLNLSLTALSRGEARARWVVSTEHPLLDGLDPRPVAPVEVEVEATAVGDQSVLVRGTMRTAVDLPCRRCLEVVREDVDEPFDLLFESLEGEEAADLEGEVYPLPTGAELDLAEALREQLVLRLPSLALCDEACRGLCPHCGTPLSASACDCVRDEDPSPWDALKQVKFD